VGALPSQSYWERSIDRLQCFVPARLIRLSAVPAQALEETEAPASIPCSASTARAWVCAP
jgi:hypothetical protein